MDTSFFIRLKDEINPLLYFFENYKYVLTKSETIDDGEIKFTCENKELSKEFTFRYTIQIIHNDFLFLLLLFVYHI